MRLASKVDQNHAEIVAALRQVGATVLDLSRVGKGCPDILVGHRSANYLMEIKDGQKTASRKTLTPQQREFFATWAGQRIVVETVDEALNVLGVVSG